MSGRTFLDMLRSEVGRMQVAHPEREGELARAHALILHGMVVPSLEDPATGQVLSSDLQTTYSVNGVCSCPAGEHGRGCKHMQAWKLYQYVQRKLDVQGSQTAQEPISTSQSTVDTSHVPDTPQGLGEAPASVNCHITLAGRQVQLTLRDTDESRLLTRLEAVLTRFPVSATPSADAQREGFCAIHHTPMRQTTKNGRTWWSHKTADGQWCKGRKRS